MLNHFDEYVNQFVYTASGQTVAGSEQYRAVMESLADIVTDIDHFYEKDEKTGVYKNPLTAENAKQLTEKYANLKENLQNFRTILGKSEASRMEGVLSGLEDIVDKDHQTLSLLHGTQKTFLPNALEEGRTQTVYLEEYETQKVVGNVLSKRHPITFTNASGKTVNGFFTEDVVVNDAVRNENPMLNMLFVSDGSSVADRNVGMSRMAELLGVGHILAPSIKMEVATPDGKKKGVFMEAISGTDLDHITKEEASKLEQVSYSEKAMKEIADLQIVDCICLNNDRHAGNLIYDFKTDEKGNTVLDGICGIDNDSSFGTQSFYDDGIDRGLVGLNRLKFCSESMADKMMALDKDVFQLAFRDLNLSEEEKNMAWSRVQTIQNKIQNHEITVVKDNEWSKIPKEQLFEARTTFANIKAKTNLRYEEFSKGTLEEADKKEILFGQATSVGTGYDVKQKLDELSDAFANTEGFFTGKSKYYKEMQKALNEAKKSCEDMLKGKNPEGYQEKLKNLEEKVNDYLEYKKDHINGSTAEQRYALASKLKTALKQSQTEKNLFEHPISEPQKSKQGQKMEFHDLLKMETQEKGHSVSRDRLSLTQSQKEKQVPQRSHSFSK